MKSLVKMYCASLLIGIGLFLKVVAEEATTTNPILKDQMQTTTAPVSKFQGTTEFNDTEKNVTDDFPKTTAENITFFESESPTPTPPSGHPESGNNTTEEHCITTSKSSITRKIPSATKYISPELETPRKSDGSMAYVIILVIIIVCIVGGTVYCCFKKKSRRQSVDLHSKKEDAQIPLSTVDGEGLDSLSVKGMQTFSPIESSVPIEDPQPVKEVEKPDGEIETSDVKDEQSNTKAVVIPEHQAEELIIVDLTDGEMAISTKTSIESLDKPQTNNNNNNNNNTGVNGECKHFSLRIIV